MRALSSVFLFIVLVAGFGWAPGSIPDARAAGVVSLSWDHPAGPGQPPITSRAFSGPGPVDLYVTVTGLTGPIQAQQVFVVINPFSATSHCSPNGPLPEAWRFDADGCQAGRLCHVGGGLRELLPDPSSPLITIADYSFDAVNQTARAVLAEVYPAILHPDPARTYTLLRLRFDFSGGGCDGAGTPLAIWMTRASYLDGSGNEIHWSIGQEVLGWNTPSPFARKGAATACTGATDEGSLLSGESLGSVQSTMAVCDLPVPAGATSWGRLKSVYR